MAEFTKVAKEYARLCQSYHDCGKGCPINQVRNQSSVCRYWTLVIDPETAEKVVLNWAADHPIKTNRKKFNETFGFDIAAKFAISEYASKWLEEGYEEPEK